ncbi:MAG TPA: nucleotidyl transferase AbiEii/AbiGii toxin family protein [Gemmatimonadales bacterium]|nr:nucleotidyl transferase AbiEii/AbiGii toxin family protein [Gemmatimonadales bacterium]
MTTPDLFGRIVARLDEAGIPYMLTGSFASAYHGRPRATQDIDFVIAPTAQQLQALLRRLPPSQYYADEGAALEALRHESQFNVVDLDTGWKIDFICRKSRPFSQTEFERRTLAQVEGRPLYIATVEDIILAKLEWAKLGGSARQIEDVARLLEVREPDLDLSYLRRWVTGLDLSPQWTAAWRAAGRDTPPEADR